MLCLFYTTKFGTALSLHLYSTKVIVKSPGISKLLLNLQSISSVKELFCGPSIKDRLYKVGDTNNIQLSNY